jgi:uncharacterized protein (TIRG00374 family)
VSRRWTIVIGIAVSAVFLYFAVRGARVDRMIHALQGANYWYMIPCVVGTLLAFWIRALRWKVLLQPLRRIPQGIVFSATMIGFLANNVLPARLGELVRAHVVGRRAQVSRSAALASILIERIFDLFTLLVLFAVVALVSEFPGGLEKVALVGLVLGLVTLLLLLLWYRQPDRFLRLALRLVPGRFRDKADDLARRFRDGLRVFDSGAQLLVVGVLSVLMWALILLVVGLSIVALDIDAPQPQSAMVALVAIALVTMVPSAPGFIGTLQGGGTAAMLVFGVPKEQGLAFTIVFHATQWFPVNIVGLYYLFREGLSFGQLSRIAGPEGEPEEEAQESSDLGPEGSTDGA